MDHCDLIIGNDGGAINMAKALSKPSFTIFSPWIRKEMWATFDDDHYHKSVHLNMYEPSHFEAKSEHELKKTSIDLYQYFKPNYIFEALAPFLKAHVAGQSSLDLTSMVKPKEIKWDLQENCKVDCSTHEPQEKDESSQETSYKASTTEDEV